MAWPLPALVAWALAWALFLLLPRAGVPGWVALGLATGLGVVLSVVGTTPWRLDRIDPDRVIVVPAEGAPAMVPFWRGEGVGRSRDLGLAMGRFLRELPGRLDDPDCERWLQDEYHLDPSAARDLRRYAQRQLATAGVLPANGRTRAQAITRSSMLGRATRPTPNATSRRTRTTRHPTVKPLSLASVCCQSTARGAGGADQAAIGGGGGEGEAVAPHAPLFRSE